MNILDAKGNCKKCKKCAQQECMECWMCKHQYHVIDCDEEEPMVQASFFRNQWPTIARKWTCITFTCPNCKEDHNTKDQQIMSRRVTLIEEMALKTSQQLESITELLSEKKSGQNQEKTYASVVSEEAPSLIVIEKPEVEISKEEKKEKLDQLNKVARESKAMIKKTYTNKTGKTVVVCNSEQSKELILPHVNKLFSERKIKTPRQKLPTVSIPFIQGSYEKEELLFTLRDQNQDCGLLFDQENVEVIFISPMKNQDNQDLYQAVLRVSEDLRRKIDSNGNRVFIGSTSCPVYDRFYVKRCNNCQGYHHYQKECKRDAVCGKCAERHATRNCNEDPAVFKCINCSVAGIEDIGHCANSHECPTYINEQEKLKKTIHYYQKN